MVPCFYSVAVGTAHGFGVFDYIQRSQISSKCTLNPSGKFTILGSVLYSRV